MKIILLLLITCLSAGAMDMYKALSMIESGDDDRAIGACGEVSRYQIMPDVWDSMVEKHAVDPSQFSPTNKDAASVVVWIVMCYRVHDFYIKNNRQPTDFEWYLIWHRPSRVFHPTAVEADRAQRFANLCGRP